uniref:Nectin-3-like n=1 Tax=Paramormyrops kingsleyae TaxID=1676925 RepID=A0A3B3SGD9_9TELE
MNIDEIDVTSSAELIRTEQLVMASFGEDVNLKCELTKQRNVKQVTWQRVSEQTSENMATYSERFGSKIADSFRKNVCFVETGLQQCSIVIRRVQWSDESCYDCLFNVFPDGAISGRTCLKIYEIHNPVFDIKPVTVSGEGILLLSCSVTGKPAPELSWDIDDTALENSTTFYTKNPNGTITVTKTATVQMTPRLLANTTVIKCAAQQEYGERKETFITVPNGETADNQSDEADTGHTVILYTIADSICISILCFLLKSRL